ncbi:MAG: toxin-antitoxin system, antitoxin component, Xre family protein [Candidatus Latescibacteria bacterium]|nr:toxin-antitoxin system, antitoxin component, Xre family protein [Candidatus Latescibacterota bacterium]
MSVKELIKQEVDNLSEELAEEVYDFVKFLEIRKEKNVLTEFSQRLSHESFSKIWDNEEDAIYDSL